jgi:hypothetical protein
MTTTGTRIETLLVYVGVLENDGDVEVESLL